ncbi:acetyltransferase (GNAT) family protein [Candidatus Methanoplasma termitum]|uniref:Acetyltransferase (GNAT) family protein n=1 Tax=Candidatus Methanoplasma termitum TaxID=1577791 RepID=A0A0A7LB00_9ARCH|nr:GNAT family N-acetyltransferase [Candidatus Methanoplasma termitum]AIZ56340.1 acetyltransferase (GNAT) family protein [Candidatus Methanoplasma termitum]MCL2333373.1 GNAT family N-acetyltransferase [Candidatus Methanoplasma sp.]
MRFCGVEEAKELADMAADIWMDYYTGFLDSEMIEYIVKMVQSESAIKQQIEDGYLYSYIMDGNDKAGYFCVVPEDKSLFMSKLYLSKDFRGKGLGSKAIDDILGLGKMMKKEKVYLRANKDNKPSIEFYKRKGFVITEDIIEDIGNGFFLDDYKMEYCY